MNMKKKEKKAKIDSVKALDEQICHAQKAALKALDENGVDSAEYAAAVNGLKELAEARAAIADTIPKRNKLDPTAFVVGGFSLASTFLLMLHDDEHAVPRWFHNGVDGLKGFLKTK